MLAGLLLIAATANGQALPKPRVVALSERVHVLLGPIQHANPANRGYMINSAVIVGDRGVILVDSGGSAEVGRHIASAVRGITDKPVTHVVNTHFHGDHYLGNVAFPDATIISSETCREMVRQTGGEWLALMRQSVGDSLPGTQPVPARVTYPDGSRTRTRIHGVPLVFWVPKASHTAGDLMVYLPEEKVLVAGDVLVNGVVPTLQDGFLKNWIGTLREIEALGAAHFVPGHGGIMVRRDVIALREAMERFQAGVKRGVRAGLREDQIRPTLDLSGWERLERSYVLGRNLNRAYLEAEADSFDE